VNKKPTYQKISKFENTCRFLFIVIELFEENSPTDKSNNMKAISCYSVGTPRMAWIALYHAVQCSFLLLFFGQESLLSDLSPA